MTNEAVVIVAGKPETAIGGEGGGELGAFGTGGAATEIRTLGRAADWLGTDTDTFGTETCTSGTEPGMLGTETCTLGTVPDAETGTAGVGTWVAGPLLWLWSGAGVEEDGEDGAGELGAEAGVPGEAAGPDETVAAPVPEGDAAAGAEGGPAGIVDATVAAPAVLGAAPVAARAGTACSATPPALAAVSVARWAAERPAWTSELGLTVVTSARASCGSAHASAAVAIAITVRHAPESRRPRLSIV